MEASEPDFQAAHYAIRLDIQDYHEQLASLQQMLRHYEGDIFRVLIVSEYAKKTGKFHFQGILHMDTSRESSMRLYIKRNIYKGDAPRGIYSLSDVKNYDDYMRYLSKGVEPTPSNIYGEEPVIVFNNYSDETLGYYRELAVEKQQEHLKKQSDIKKKRKVLTGATKCLAYLEEHRSSFIDDEGYLDQAKMAHIIISFFRNTSVVHDKIIFRKFYNLANNHFNPKGHVRTMLADLRYETTLSKVLVSTGRSVGEALHLKYDDVEYDELEKELISNEVLNNDE